MSKLEKQIYALSILLLPLNYFLPELWRGIFSSFNSNASGLYQVSVFLLIFSNFVFLIFTRDIFLKRKLK